MKQRIILLIALIIPQLAGAFGALFTTSAIPTWYATLVRPDIAPPNSVFGPVWTTLYLLMGLASYLVYRKGIEKREVRIALGVYAAHLILNAAWSIVFFGLKDIGLALIVVSLLWLSIVATMVLFARLSKMAVVLFLPYLFWVSFASYLNYAFWVLNP